MSVVVLLPLLLLTQAVSLATGIVIILAAMRMMRLKSHGLATVASVLAMLPCGPAWLLGLPIGIWSLMALSRPNVKAAFAAHAMDQPAQRLSSATAGVGGRRGWFFGTALVLISLILLGLWFGSAMLDRRGNKGLLEIETVGGIQGAKVLVTRGVEQAAMIDVATRPF